MNIPKLDERLLTAKGFVKPGGNVADIGTDHAYLPVTLVLEGKCTSALATDINDGPLERAKINILLSGVADKIQTLKTDGLCGVEKYDPDNILILGMGGELITRILSEAPWLSCRKDRRIVLQPMTHPECVRRYLAENGFHIVDERVCKSGKYYDVIAAEYDGKRRKYSDIELLFGKINKTRRDEVTLGYAESLRKIFEVRAAGLRMGGSDASYEEAIVQELKKILSVNG